VIFLTAFACFPASLLIGEPVVFGLGVLLLTLSGWRMRRNLGLGPLGFAPLEMMYPSTFRAAWRRARNGDDISN
jgi:hypothetical protein